MDKIKIHEFPLGIYPRKIWIANKCTAKEISDTFCRSDFKDIDFSQEVGSEPAATVFPNVMLRKTGEYGVLIVIYSKLRTGQIAHEAGHVATEIFRDIGAYLDPDNQEPFMYLLGYVADCIDKVLKNKFE